MAFLEVLTIFGTEGARSLLFVVGLLFAAYSLFHAAVFIGCYVLKKRYMVKADVRRINQDGRFKGAALPEGAYDAIVVGAGPSGGVFSYYAVTGGARVALLERKSFPRDKYCGDACCVPALRILRDIGVMKELEDKGEAYYPDSGGFVTPGGLSYIGASVEEVGEPLTCAIKRTVLDMTIARRAQQVGADLIEEFEVESATFDADEGLWTVSTEGDEKRVIKGRVLVCADGSPSKLGRKIGYVTAPPRGVSTRAFVKGGTHNAKLDGLIVYPPFSLPGYCAVFKHPRDELNFCFYLIPCSETKLGDVEEKDLPSLHQYAITRDPFVSRLLGPKAEIEPMRVAPLRVALEGVKSTYGDHVLLVGDAAGFIDPITGEGIHSAMMSGRDAALTLLDMCKAGNFSAAAAAQYEDRWTNSFGYDFHLSRDAAWLIWKFPLLLDACVEEMQRTGNSIFSEWAKIMTSYNGKELFLEHRMAAPLFLAVLRCMFKRFVLGLFFPGMRKKYPAKWIPDATAGNEGSSSSSKVSTH